VAKKAKKAQGADLFSLFGSPAPKPKAKPAPVIETKPEIEELPLESELELAQNEISQEFEGFKSAFEIIQEDPIKKDIILNGPDKAVDEILQNEFKLPNRPANPPFNMDRGMPAMFRYFDDGLFYHCRACGANHIGTWRIQWDATGNYHVNICMACGEAKVHMVWEVPETGSLSEISQEWRYYMERVKENAK